MIAFIIALSNLTNPAISYNKIKMMEATLREKKNRQNITKLHSIIG